MIRLDHRQPIPESLRGAILALGNFDGFHQGHQAVVGEAVRWAKEQGRPVIVATFDPHPRRYFEPDTSPFRLTTLDQREELFAQAGADAMLVFYFDKDMAGMSAEGWVGKMLHRQLHLAGVVTGEDFTFAKGKSGNAESLKRLGEQFDIEARSVGAVHDSEGAISSSRARDALKEGDCTTARRMLTRPFAIRATVQHGDKRGREIGFPTANMDLGTYLRPRFGIYAVTGRLPDGRLLHGAANIGIRPSFDPPKELLEPYFFDFSEDLYGQDIEVAFHHFLRPEAKFGSLDELTAQMERDCDNARKLLSAAQLN
ncbi:MAG: bifunctional riboflavin kinase/FAD synthetase [Sphingomonadaceae bacterium]|nr:bifunctional riboflavin kinase/FAD synthetase [Sphingomonadaceae bacterium]